MINNQNRLFFIKLPDCLGIRGTLMIGWTMLLLWAVQQPIERRFVILLTASPVVAGLSVIALIGMLNGSTSNIWILVKNTILFVSMMISYKLSEKLTAD